MSDEGMSDAHLKALAGLYKDADDSGMESKWEAIGNALCNAYPLIIARLDAAERERDALREALQETDDFIERVNLDEQICCSGQDCGCRGSTQRDYLLHNIRAALTANHSAPVVEE